jgi:hypothetical protein
MLLARFRRIAVCPPGSCTPWGFGTDEDTLRSEVLQRVGSSFEPHLRKLEVPYSPMPSTILTARLSIRFLSGVMSIVQSG